MNYAFYTCIPDEPDYIKKTVKLRTQLRKTNKKKDIHVNTKWKNYEKYTQKFKYHSVAGFFN